MIDDVSDLERDNLEKYSGKYYQADKITLLPPAGSSVYSDVLLQLRLDMVARLAVNAKVLDLCCGSGDHLLFFADSIQEGIGFDYSAPFLLRGTALRDERKIDNVNFLQGNARKLPFKKNYFELIYSFSSLYHVPKVDQVIGEASRILKTGGMFIFDLGNLYSLNTLVCRAYTELAYPYHIPVQAMKKYIIDSGLKIIEHRAFQTLPMWADRPRWLRPLLMPALKRIMARQVHGKMLDEWISNLPILKKIAFRHVFICEKY
jgi:SAM-dependent methyltransferase